jgi:hypothetical protein
MKQSQGKVVKAKCRSNVLGLRCHVSGPR